MSKASKAVRSVRRHPRRLAGTLALTAAVCVGLVMTATAISQPAKGTSVVPLKSLPASVLPYYEGVKYWGRLFSDPYKNYTPPKAPWKFCLSTNYLGNGWEVGNKSELEKLVGQYQAAGLATGGLKTVNSNFSIPVQLTQLNSLIAAGCDVIFAIPGSPTAFCKTFEKARAKNILVVTDDTVVYCDNVINSAWPNMYSARIQAEGLAKALGGKGNVVMLTGFPGALGTEITVAGWMNGLKKYPGIKVLGRVQGNWTESVAQTAMTTFLATHPEKVDGILDGANMATGPVQAMIQAGRPLPKITLYDVECSALALWKKHPGLVAASQDQGPQLAAYESFLVAARLLYGQHAKVNTLIYPIPGPTEATFNQWYKPTMTEESTCMATPPPSAITPDSYYDQFFKGGTTPKVKLKLVDAF